MTTAVLLDAHAWAWSLSRDARLSHKAVALIQRAEAIFVSPISLFEIGQKVRIGKWPQMQPFVSRLVDLLAEQGGRGAALIPDICLAAATLEWDAISSTGFWRQRPSTAGCPWCRQIRSSIRSQTVAIGWRGSGRLLCPAGRHRERAEKRGGKINHCARCSRCAGARDGTARDGPAGLPARGIGFSELRR